jgi:hypothetical protein
VGENKVSFKGLSFRSSSGSIPTRGNTVSRWETGRQIEFTLSEYFRPHVIIVFRRPTIHRRLNFSYERFALLFQVMADDSPSQLLVTLANLTRDFELCRNRVWAVAKSVSEDKRGELLKIPLSLAIKQRGVHKGHDQCTFDFCEHSRLDFTSVAQRHECLSNDPCKLVSFEAKKLEKAANAGKWTAWTLDGHSVIEPPQSFMAVSNYRLCCLDLQAGRALVLFCV